MAMSSWVAVENVERYSSNGKRVAMNPVDHPHGGGEGRTSGGRHPVSPWAVPTKGYKTRKNKRTAKFIITGRKSKKEKVKRWQDRLKKDRFRSVFDGKGRQG